ncbi:divalent metal cation transporter [Bacteriovoracaceae bacterium]|nr:divalent metal cation transporter [Bacteriovoracaceae bacterium]
MRISIKDLGPGLLYAGAAIGVSHLVQSTRAGAMFALDLILVILLANFFKFPFFYASFDFTRKSKQNILQGYSKVSKYSVPFFIFITLISMFFILAAITVVTAGLFEQMFSFGNIRLTSLILMLPIFIFLMFKNFKLLESTMTFIILLLSLCTITTILFALLSPNFTIPTANYGENFSLDNSKHIFFLVAFIGWMPAPLDVSLWQSLWQVKHKNHGDKDNFKKSAFDFHVGYWGTMIMAIAFLLIGYFGLYNQPSPLPMSAIKFSMSLINSYTDILGPVIKPIITIAAFFTMFSTSLTCFDAFPRALEESFVQIKKPIPHWFFLLITFVGTGSVIWFMLQNMKTMVDFATTVSFVFAPFFCVMNTIVYFKLIKNRNKVFSRFMLFSCGLHIIFALYYLWIKFI